MIPRASSATWPNFTACLTAPRAGIPNTQKFASGGEERDLTVGDHFVDRPSFCCQLSVPEIDLGRWGSRTVCGSKNSFNVCDVPSIACFNEIPSTLIRA